LYLLKYVIWLSILFVLIPIYWQFQFVDFIKYFQIVFPLLNDLALALVWDCEQLLLFWFFEFRLIPFEQLLQFISNCRFSSSRHLFVFYVYAYKPVENYFFLLPLIYFLRIHRHCYSLDFGLVVFYEAISCHPHWQTFFEWGKYCFKGNDYMPQNPSCSNHKYSIENMVMKLCNVVVDEDKWGMIW